MVSASATAALGDATSTATPWGPSGELRARRLRPGPGHSAEEVALNQRDRLFGATVAVVAEQGYEPTRVADILDLAGVSRSAFYRHFANKRECFLATLEELVRVTGLVAAHSYNRSDMAWDLRLRTLFDTIVRLIVTQPAASRLWFVESYSAGPEAVEWIEQFGDRLEDLAVAAFDETPERAGMPRHVVRALIGGVRQVIHTRLRMGREEELVGLTPDLLEWALSYRTPREPLRRPRRPPPLTPASHDADEPRARIVAAVTELVAERGYHELTISEIAQRAAISLTTFYGRFPTKADAYVAAIDDGERRLLETTLPIYSAAPDWPHAVKDGIHALFAFLTENPATAQLGGMNILAGGARALERHEESNRGFQALLYPGYRGHPQVSAVASEAIGGAVTALLYQQLRLEGTGRLYEIAPAATFLALAPFLGSDAAGALANEGWHPAPTG
jgi:AcrR family transcriptional regulator